MNHWRGIVAVILASALAVGFAAAMVGATVQHEPISQQGAALLTTLGGALIGAVAGWLGGSTVHDETAEPRHARRDRKVTPVTETSEIPDPDKVPGSTPVQDQEAVPADADEDDVEQVEPPDDEIVDDRTRLK